MKINSMCSWAWARVPTTVEVRGLFSFLIPARDMSKFESGRARQSLVPDFRFNLHTDLGGSQVKLAELKVINCYKTWYSSGAGGKVRATNKRAGSLTTLYKQEM